MSNKHAHTFPLSLSHSVTHSLFKRSLFYCKNLLESACWSRARHRRHGCIPVSMAKRLLRSWKAYGNPLLLQLFVSSHISYSLLLHSSWSIIDTIFLICDFLLLPPSHTRTHMHISTCCLLTHQTLLLNIIVHALGHATCTSCCCRAASERSCGHARRTSSSSALYIVLCALPPGHPCTHCGLTLVPGLAKAYCCVSAIRLLLSGVLCLRI